MLLIRYLIGVGINNYNNMKRILLILGLFIGLTIGAIAQNINPVFGLVPHFYYGSGPVTAVTTDKTGATATNLITLFTCADANGVKVTEIGYHFQGNSAAGLFLIFISNTSGTSPLLYYEIPISAITSSTTVAAASGFLTFSDLQLANGQKVLVGITTISGSVACNGYCKVADF